MKQINLYTGLFLILFTSSVFIGCDKEESLFGDRDVTSGMYELNVTSSGFVPAEGQSSENAEPINIPFVNDDAMGLVMVEGDKITHTRYMYKELLGKWSGDLTVKNPSAKIYAYYPYNEALEISSLNTQGTNAAEFFSQMIANFVPQADQSKAENFRKSNLMIGTASIDEAGKKIAINMESAMALAVVKVDPNQNGIMSLESDPNYTWEVEGISTESLAPFYKFSENTFVGYIIPEKEQIVSTSSGKVVVSSIAKSTYQECVLSLIHRLQVGDFFMKDGSLIGKDAILTEEQKANCIGIVFQTDENRIGETEKTALGGMAHGLVMALKNESGSVEASAGSNRFPWGKIPTDGNKEISAISGTKQQCYEDMSGLKNSQEIWTKMDGISEDNYNPFRYAKDFSSQVMAPKNTTGWFLPSVGQWWDIFRNLGGCTFLDGEASKDDKVNVVWKPLPGNKKDLMKMLNAQLNKIGGVYVDIFGDRTFDALWSSSEFSYDYVIYLTFTEAELNITARSKTEGRDSRVRCILAF